MVIFLHGDDTYRSREKLRELSEKFLREVDPSGTNLVTIDGAITSASEIWGAIAAQSFLVRKRMVVIENLGAQKSDAVRSEVAAFLEKIPEDAIVVFWEPRSRVAGKPTPTSSPPSKGRGRKRGRDGKAISQQQDSFFPLLIKQADHVQEFAPLEGVALTRWVRDQAKALGASFEPAAMQEFIAAVGSDLWRMCGELEKLTLAVRTGIVERGTASLPVSASSVGIVDRPTTPYDDTSRDTVKRTTTPTITTTLIRELVAAVPPEDIFGFVDAVGRGDRATALRILRELEAARVDPQYLLAMLHRQLRFLVMAADCLERGIPASRLAVELGVHPFVAQKLVRQVAVSQGVSGGLSQQARGASSSKFCALYPRLLELDRALKSSRAPWEALVELFCLEATAAQ